MTKQEAIKRLTELAAKRFPERSFESYAWLNDDELARRVEWAEKARTLDEQAEITPFARVSLRRRAARVWKKV